MTRLQDTLVARYARHYRRVNAAADLRSLPARAIKGMELTYGPFVRGLPAGTRVLDVGCGSGVLLRWLTQHENVVPAGVDASLAQAAAAARALPGVEVVCRDGLEFLRANPTAFGGIFCIDVLEHVPGDDLLLEWVEAAAAALTPGGFFVCRTPNAANLTAAHARYMDLTHHRSFTAASLLQLLEAGGLADCRAFAPRAATLAGRLRRAVETLLHRLVFRICGRGAERIFTYDVYAAGFRAE